MEKVTETSTRYFVITALAEQYKDKKITFEKLMEISEVMDRVKCAEFVTLLWRLASKYAKERFAKDFSSKDLDNPLREKYFQYLKG